MNIRPRLWYSGLIFAVALVLLAIASRPGPASAGLGPPDEAAAPLPAGARQEPPVAPDVPTLGSGQVPVVVLPREAPNTAKGTDRSATAQVAATQIPEFVMDPAAPLAPDLATSMQQDQEHAARASAQVPASGALGDDNAFLSISPDVLRPNTQVAGAVVASGFRPFEMVVISFGGIPGGFAQANADGVVFGTIISGGQVGYSWVRAQGLYSGKMAGGSLQISNTAPSVPGLAVAPHAIRPGDRLYILGVRYTNNTTVNIARNNTVLGTYAVDNLGRTPLISVVVGAGPDGAAVYNSYSTNTAVGTLAGQSIEERADAGPGGNLNPAWAFIDRPIISSTVTTTLGLVGEGFTPGETVNLIRQPGSVLMPSTADSNGAVPFLIESPPGANVYNIRLSGQTSGRQAYAVILDDNRAYNVASTIVAPSRAFSASGNIVLLFTRYTPNSQLAVRVDGNVVGAVNSGPGGYGSIPRPKPVGTPIVHDYAISETFGTQISSAPLAMVRTGKITGHIRDGVSGRPIKALIQVGNDRSAVVESDPTASGVYTITYPASDPNRTYALFVLPSGCYLPTTVAAAVPANGTVTVDVNLSRSPNDRVGYTCYENAGRAYQPAPTQVFNNTFNENAQNFTLPFPVQFSGATVTSGTIASNGFITLGSQFTCTTNCFKDNQQINFNGNTAPPNGFIAANWDDLAGLSTDQNSGVYSGIVGSAPNRTFIVEWRNVLNYNDSTDVINTFELQIDEATSDIYLVYPTFNLGGSDGREGTIGFESLDGRTGKQVQGNTVSGDRSQELKNYIWPGNSIRLWRSVIPTPTSTPTITRTPLPTRTPAPTFSPTPETCRADGNYSQLITRGAGIVPGTTDIGNHGDNIDTIIDLPFAYTFYTQTFTTARVNSNGLLQFSGSILPPNDNSCLSSSALNNAILAYWDNLRTDGAGGVGIFTSVTGNSPNRVFNIEWRACVFASAGCTGIDTNFEIRLHENQRKIDLVYGSLLQNGLSATSGIQQGTSQRSRQYACNTQTLSQGLDITYALIPCNTPTPTNTRLTNTPVPTRTFTPIPTIPTGTLTPVSICGVVPVHFFAAPLDAHQEVPPNGSPATGQANFSFNAPTGVMSYTISFQGLVAAETAADLNMGAAGQNGALILSLPLGNPASGTVNFPADHVADLYAGRIYLNVHSSAFPNGEIRGQLGEQCVITPTPSPCPSCSPTPTRTPCPSCTATPTNTIVPTNTPPVTPCAACTATPTIPPGVTNTPTITPCTGCTATPTRTACPTCTATPTATPVTCAMNFTDVSVGVYYYEPVHYMYCRGIISGYLNHTFRPFNNTTRSQFAKMLVLGLNWAVINPTTASFNDVPVGSPFYTFVETAKAHGVITGYGCGTRDGEPCPGRYFRPFTDITRAQISKLIALGMNWPLLSPSTATFIDVPLTYPFYQAIETSYAHNVITGYGCGAGCRYFRPEANATRAQLSKMLWVAITQP